MPPPFFFFSVDGIWNVCEWNWLLARAQLSPSSGWKNCCSSGIKMCFIYYFVKASHFHNWYALMFICCDYTEGKEWLHWSFEVSYIVHLSLFLPQLAVCHTSHWMLKASLVFTFLLGVKEDPSDLSIIVTPSLPATHTGHSVPMATWFVNWGTFHQNCSLLGLSWKNSRRPHWYWG